RSHRRPTRFASVLGVAAAVAIGVAIAPRAARADARTEARAHFKKGMKLISDGKYDDGVVELEHAYEILPHPNVLYNIARAPAEARDRDAAVQGYKRYLEPNPSDRDEVAQIVATLEARINRQRAIAAAAQAPAPPPPTATVPPPPPPPPTATPLGP